MDTGQVYLGQWAMIGRYHCRWWLCSKHGKIRKAVEVVRVVGKVYLVHNIDEGFSGIKIGFKQAKKAHSHASRDRCPLCPYCKQ